jgi:hypothetical protein
MCFLNEANVYSMICNEISYGHDFIFILINSKNIKVLIFMYYSQLQESNQ